MDHQNLPKGTTRYTISGITHYLRNNRWCQCASKRPKINTEQQDKAEASYTEAQRAARSVFALVGALTRAFFKQFPRKRGWKVFASAMALTHDKLFHKFNTGCCDTGGVFNFQAFLFSVGWLASPVYTRVKREAWTITLEWSDRCDRKANRGTDRLVIGYFYDCYRDAPRVLEYTGATRADGRVTFTLPGHKLDAGMVLHLYPFFTRDEEGEEDFSRSFYLKTPDGMELEL